MDDHKDEGLIHKYNVTRVDGKPVGEGIFLQFDDPKAQRAILLWANEMEKEGYHELYHDVREKLTLALMKNELAVHKLQNAINSLEENKDD